MKRIISLILVVVMALAVLSGCAYSYEKDEMTNYATFNSADFFKALTDGSILVEDADFGTDEEERAKKVTDAIFTALAKSADTDAKITEGVPGAYDLFYYCYFISAVVDGEYHIFSADKMTESKPTNFQLGLSTVEGLNAKIADLLMDKAAENADFTLKDYIYETVTADDTATKEEKENVTKQGDVVYVSYTKEFTQLAFDKDGNPIMDGSVQATETKKVTVAYERVVLEGAEGSFLANLVGKTVGESSKFEVEDETLDTDDKTVNYSAVKVNWIVKNDKELGTVKDTTYTEKKELADVKGDKIDLKDVELTYHIFPVYLVKVADKLTADVVIDEFYTQLAATKVDPDDSTKTVNKFDAVANGEYKNGDKTLADLVADLKKYNSDLTSAESALKKAEEAVKKAGDAATETEKAAVTTAKGDVEKAEKGIKDTKDLILKCTSEKEGAKPIEEALVEGMIDYQYDELETAYKSAIKNSLAEKVYELAKKYITYKTEGGVPVLPKRAVRDAYKRIENGHKVDFYEGSYKATGSSTSTSESNYHHYKGDFNEYLKVAYFGKDAAKYTMQNVYDKIGAEAEQAVRDVILVYTLADVFAEKGEDLSVTEEQIDTFRGGYLYWIYENYYGGMEESDYMPALLFDNIFNHILEETKEEDYKEDAEYGKNKVQYLNINYGFESEDEEADEDKKD